MMAGLSDAEGQKLLDLLNQLNIKPDIADADALEQWLDKFGSQKPPDVDSKPPPVQLLSQSQWPKLSNFSGGQPGKNEVAYDEWQYEVRCLLSQNMHSEGAILQAIRRSLHGEAGRVVMRLGPLASIPDIMHKLDGVYGTVE